MALIEWKPEYALGIEDVDHEHRELVALINDLHAALSRPDSGVTVPDFLGELHAQISAHFALEERIMRAHGYDALEAHKADHERLLDDVRELMDAWDDGAYPDIAAFSSRLDTWFSEHFRTHDARLHRML